MCGIAGVHFKDTTKYAGKNYVSILERFCDELLLGIENRGTDATGFVSIGSGRGTVLDKNNIKATDFIKTRKKLLPDTRTVLLHTRFATKGEPEFWNNNHPVFSGSTFTVHNGTIYNDDELFKEHSIERVGQVDSEIIPALLNKHTLDQAPKAFAELLGGFATASVDPVRFPNVTVLGKGGSWPLVVVDAKEFVVWASTKEAIRRAWGTVLGTPPSDKQYHFLSSGDVWILNGELVDRLPKAFEHKGSTKPWQRGSTNSGSGYGSAGGWDDWYHQTDDEEALLHRPTKQRTYKSPKNGRIAQTFDLKADVRALEQKGEAIAYRWENKSDEDVAKYLDKHGTGHWSYCRHCTRTVPELQAHAHDSYGTTCMDCLILIGKVAKDTKAQFLAQFDFDESDLAMLERFAAGHTALHLKALRQVAEETGLKRAFVEFLIFRCDATYLEASKPVTDLYCNLTDRYTDTVAELWDEWLEKEDEDEDPTDPYINCVSGGVHRESEACESCDNSCGVQIEKKPEPRELCLLCNRKAKHWLGLTHAWCRRHFDKCVVRGCKAKTKGYETDGKRRCHEHSRGIVGFIADNDTKARKHLLVDA